MYADRIEAGRKRSIKDRLNGDLVEDLGRARPRSGKRQRQNDDKWTHDLYEADEQPQTSKSIGPKDLRLKLQKKGLQQAVQVGKGSGVRDLREKLSGTMHPQPSNTDMTKARPVSEIAKLIKKNISSVEAPVPETKKISNPTSSRKTSQKKSELSVDGFLRSLGLEKYVITFQAEEVDMTALMHMTDDDLKALGIPMGPRKKILLELESKT
uniref:Ankyrin repeat and SAM domain-containing protein 6 n=1 Tax=Elaeis guineensis var. tenera TaxID=51953 RepID=A0A6I9RNJ1_ELAGV|nr:ankyrin repeat and SAM domain-containing protein 6 [Elaeis guineensis]XP_029122283.1 ankyrin repeat and SAM domain-containing protein 6 [Elaeis guineensis]XP_029122284.1 ankyrin repeat and SAM domain-containing protein 6 [Elaeis guineensis]